MGKQFVLSLDTGMSNGVALGYIDDDTPYTLVKAWQFVGGVSGMIEWLNTYSDQHDRHNFFPEGSGKPVMLDHIISERFQPINHGNYALTTASVESLRVEGALVALGVMPDVPHPTWRQPKDQYLYGGSDLAEKKKRARLYLKSRGMHLTGKTVGQADADDARSATLHGISYAVKVLHHRPTSASITEWSESYGLD